MQPAAFSLLWTYTHTNRCYRRVWPFGLMRTVGCSTWLPKPETPCDNKTRDMVMGSGSSKPHKMQSSHIKVSRSSPQAQFSPAETPRQVCRRDHATHLRPRLCPSLSLWPQPSSSIAPPHTHTCTSLAAACACWMSANLMYSQGAACSLYISDTEQVANYKNHSGAWLVRDITAALLHAEWGKWACQPGSRLLWWVQMRQGPGSLLGSVVGIDGAAGCVKTHTEKKTNTWCNISDLEAVRRSRSIRVKQEGLSYPCASQDTAIKQQVCGTLGVWSDTQYPQCMR